MINKLTSIDLVINTFKKVLNDYKTALNKDMHIEHFICIHAYDKYGVNLQYLFKRDGYYKHYIGSFALKLPENIWSKEEKLRFKIDFLKTEIKELTELKNKGYTHI